MGVADAGGGVKGAPWEGVATGAALAMAGCVLAGGRWSCPACGSADRAVAVHADGWSCHRCRAGGPVGASGVVRAVRARMGLPDGWAEAAWVARAKGWGLWGGWSGSFSAGVCGALAAGSEVWVGTDDDLAGWGYAAQIAARVGPGVVVRRVVVPGGADWAAMRQRKGAALDWGRMVEAGRVVSAAECEERVGALKAAKALCASNNNAPKGAGGVG